MPLTERETRDASWRAINGHTMDGYEVRFRDPQSGETSPWRSEGWSATHSSECRCWSSDEGFTGFDDE